MPPTPLLKALVAAGAGSRRSLADAIKGGEVRVNGAVVEDFRHPVNVGTDRVTIGGRPADLRPRELVYLVLHKPRGVLSTTSDERGRGTVIGIIPEKYRHLRLYPVGRLDRDSTGLLLLTNDGALTYRLTHPKFEHQKEYLVHLDGEPRSDEVRALERGIELEDGPTHPAVVKKVADHPPFNYSITVHEGRKRQVRRMFQKLGHEVLALKRIRIGSLALGDLPEGGVREITPQEVRRLDAPTVSGG